jgi:hypothetical protein
MGRQIRQQYHWGPTIGPKSPASRPFAMLIGAASIITFLVVLFL